jgi:hypothetical protein
MEIKLSTSTNFEDYEILIRKKGLNNYTSYCPQINLILAGTVHEEVVQMMQEKINEHISKLTDK